MPGQNSDPRPVAALAKRKLFNGGGEHGSGLWVQTEFNGDHRLENVGHDQHPTAIEHNRNGPDGWIGFQNAEIRTVEAMDPVQNDTGGRQKKPAPPGAGTGSRS